MVDPAVYARSGTEHGEQVALFAWAALNVQNAPELRWLHAIPNGGERHKAVAASMKAEGARTGVVDVFLPCPRPIWNKDEYVRGELHLARNWYHGLYIEMKKPAAKLKRGPNGPGPWDYGGVSDDQKEFLDFVTAQGYKGVVCYSWVEAANAIKIYLTGSGL